MLFQELNKTIKEKASQHFFPFTWPKCCEDFKCSSECKTFPTLKELLTELWSAQTELATVLNGKTVKIGSLTLNVTNVSRHQGTHHQCHHHHSNHHDHHWWCWSLDNPLLTVPQPYQLVSDGGMGLAPLLPESVPVTLLSPGSPWSDRIMVISSNWIMITALRKILLKYQSCKALFATLSHSTWNLALVKTFSNISLYRTIYKKCFRHYYEAAKAKSLLNNLRSGKSQGIL